MVGSKCIVVELDGKFYPVMKEVKGSFVIPVFNAEVIQESGAVDNLFEVSKMLPKAYEAKMVSKEDCVIHDFRIELPEWLLQAISYMGQPYPTPSPCTIPIPVAEMLPSTLYLRYMDVYKYPSLENKIALSKCVRRYLYAVYVYEVYTMYNKVTKAIEEFNEAMLVYDSTYTTTRAELGFTKLLVTLSI